MTPRALLAVLVAAACGTPVAEPPDGPRYHAERERVSFVAPEGWTTGRERDALVFTSHRNTIAVRSVPVEHDWVKTRAPELVFPATETYLRALPGATVSGSDAIRRAGFQGRVFSVTFQPRSAPTPYERRHAVLVGAKRVVHVVLTAPVGFLDETRAEFDAVIASLREEV
jgi:hypothetical protein